MGGRAERQAVSTPADSRVHVSSIWRAEPPGRRSAPHIMDPDVGVEVLRESRDEGLKPPEPREEVGQGRPTRWAPGPNRYFFIKPGVRLGWEEESRRFLDGIGCRVISKTLEETLQRQTIRPSLHTSLDPRGPPVLPVLIDSLIRNEQQRRVLWVIVVSVTLTSSFCLLIGQSYQTLSSGSGGDPYPPHSENEESVDTSAQIDAESFQICTKRFILTSGIQISLK
ncbi:unnamed protein product [Pleuronectes platessa]|uniref:Uncharacterized protein n=1 Tax=Pleuronectes platessa TaxID=8262 RepID=A0A9N7VRM5_PLEPL|nr:unnamed protein product [Pleuronectes platessa]